MDTKTRDLARKLLARWKDDPALFAQEALGLRVWEGQKRILDAIAHNSRVAVRSGHKTGKSKSAAIIAHWWVCTRQRAKVVMTAPTYRQVNEILWTEFRVTFRGAKFLLGPKPAIKPDTGQRLEDGRAVYGFSTKEPERMAGISGDELLFIVDEASGVEEKIFEAIEGNSAGGASVLLFSNPTQTSGTFFDAFHTKADFWKGIHVSSEDASKVEPPIKGLATKEWLELKREEWGEDSPIFAVRAAGNFPSQSSDSVVTLSSVLAAIERHEEGEAPTEGDLDIGVDVARFGDDSSCIIARRGDWAYPVESIQGADGVVVAAKAVEVAERLRGNAKRVNVKVDVIGVGASVVDQLNVLAKTRPWLKVCPVNVSEVANDQEKYRKLRDELWFLTSIWLREGGCIPDDGKLQSELVGPRYTFDEKARYKVESKDEIRKRIGRSPDRADALCLAVYPADFGVKISDVPNLPDEGRFGDDGRGY